MNWKLRLWWLTVPAVTIASGIRYGWEGLEWTLVYIPFVAIVEGILYFQRKNIKS